MPEQPTIHPPRFFPPWGQQTIGDVAGAHANLGIPKHWKIGQNLGPGALLQTWNKFIADTLKAINETLWPSFDFTKRDWPGGFEGRQRDLTTADLAIMLDMQGAKLLDQPIQSPVAGPAVDTHRNHFAVEDASSLGDRHVEYDAFLSRDLLAAVPVLLWSGLDNKSAATAKQLKRHLQRPRPYQMAAMSGIPNFRHLHADTADSPSMISGHGIAGMIGVGTVIDRWIMDGVTVPPQSFKALQQYAVDIGDRRVYAGVHYPSDNIAAWITTLLLGKEVFESKKETLRHLWAAIQGSLVYRAVVASKAEVYQDSLNLLDKLRSRI